MSLPHALSEFVDQRYALVLARCRDADVPYHDDAGVAEHVQRVLLVSDFAHASFLREPELLGADALAMMSDPRHADARPLLPEPEPDDASAMRALRRYRRRESIRLIWRDVNGLDSVAETIAGSSALAESCLAAAYAFAEKTLARRHGFPRSESGERQRLIVLGLGKLGGGELNFSSDIDLILAYPENGVSDGAHVIANETWFARCGQLLAKLLGEITVDGFAYRVDLRLRPFGSAGRVALSFAAMEQYYQREGRDWERYAWIKARPVAGDLVAGKHLLQTLRPFVYRRYLDYTAFSGLREMKKLIDSEVARKDLSQHLKLGPGGIREIEFIVQLLQLIRGGREPSLRETGLLSALTACEHLGALSSASAKTLREAYLFLRRIENRVQMLRDEQTHDLPNEPFDRERMAAGLGYAGWPQLYADIAKTRNAVGEEFASVLAPVQPRVDDIAETAPTTDFWQRLVAGESSPGQLQALGFENAPALHAQFAALVANPAARSLVGKTRARFDRLMPRLLGDAAASTAAAASLERLLRLVQTVLRRPAYLVLLEEQPAARARVVALFADSALLAERVIAHPLLLDDMLSANAPGEAALSSGIERRVAHVAIDDDEKEIEILQEEKQSATFRLGLNYRQTRDAVAASRALSDAAEVIIDRVAALAERDVARRHGRLDGGGVAVIGYGSLGGAELGFASDLDLVFVYDGALAQSESDGDRPLDGSRYSARIAQRIVHWLTTQTHAGKLYDVDIRLRPDGGKGLLVVSLDAFEEYQRERAWIWETQALVRARAICGDEHVCRRFRSARNTLLTRRRDADDVRTQIASMRQRWRAERDRSNATTLDLKQGAGTLLDIEFILQTIVLLHAHEKPTLLGSGNSAELIGLASGVLEPSVCDALAAAHSVFLGRSLDCTLDMRPRSVPRDADLQRHASRVLEIAASLGLDFGTSAAR
ncbi:MAG TPA: bifunctional [glutamate--ammonia ligase]-adenylyl-L-tyrosine phosphorylase/[glutamate--ammonia-ligase] adenylyltransferase [Rudaea sp.]|jgi:glutamate-ammonia-ligase adenylyltransferase|nr:bifunctional [glutamate--ammonia ligase]-adenylyl-L-tyrosine phosphorylase/[glutamate--ammonia-ligase] adenylyltransferase [Rudaea sp.]